MKARTCQDVQRHHTASQEWATSTVKDIRS